MSKASALLMVAGGVIFNNYVYLHDLILNKHDGLIELGTKSSIAIPLSLIVIGLGVRGLMRSSESTPGT